MTDLDRDSGLIAVLVTLKSLPVEEIEGILRIRARALDAYLPSLLEAVRSDNEVLGITPASVENGKFIIAVLLMLMASTVSPWDPYSRTKEVSKLQDASKALEVSFADVLSLLRHEDAIRTVLKDVP